MQLTDAARQQLADRRAGYGLAILSVGFLERTPIAYASRQMDRFNAIVVRNDVNRGQLVIAVSSLSALDTSPDFAQSAFER